MQTLTWGAASPGLPATPFPGPCETAPSALQAAGYPVPATRPADLANALLGHLWLDSTGGPCNDVQVLGLDSIPQTILANVRSHSVIAYVRGVTHLSRRFAGARLCERVARGDLALKSFGTAGEWAWDGATSTIQVFLSPQLLDRTGAEIFGPRAGSWRLRDSVRTRDDDLFERVGQLAREAASSDPGSELMVKALGKQLAVLLPLRRHADLITEAASPRRQVFDVVQRRRIMLFMTRHLEQTISVADLARQEGLEVDRFARVFRATFDAPPHEYMRTLRLQRARELLGDATRSLAEVACDTGFSDQSHFTRAFKQHFGEPPGAWRNRVGAAPTRN